MMYNTIKHPFLIIYIHRFVGRGLFHRFTSLCKTGLQQCLAALLISWYDISLTDGPEESGTGNCW